MRTHTAELLSALILQQTDACVVWPGLKKANYYPTVCVLGLPRRVNRLVLEMDGVVLRQGECAMHSCDNPHCVNRRHLAAGSFSDNAIDMATKGRGRKVVRPRVITHPNKQTPRIGNRGSLNGNCRMTEQEVGSLRFDRASGMKLEDLSKKYGCSVSTASRLSSFKTHRSTTATEIESAALRQKRASLATGISHFGRPRK